jgi:hypothetical protein
MPARKAGNLPATRSDLLIIGDAFDGLESFESESYIAFISFVAHKKS